MVIGPPGAFGALALNLVMMGRNLGIGPAQIQLQSLMETFVLEMSSKTTLVMTEAVQVRYILILKVYGQ